MGEDIGETEFVRHLAKKTALRGERLELEIQKIRAHSLLTDWILAIVALVLLWKEFA